MYAKCSFASLRIFKVYYIRRCPKRLSPYHRCHVLFVEEIEERMMLWKKTIMVKTLLFLNIQVYFRIFSIKEDYLRGTKPKCSLSIAIATLHPSFL